MGRPQRFCKPACRDRYYGQLRNQPLERDSLCGNCGKMFHQRRERGADGRLKPFWKYCDWRCREWSARSLTRPHESLWFGSPPEILDAVKLLLDLRALIRKKAP